VGKHDFGTTVAAKIAQAAMHFCSNPTCLRLTGYSTNEGKVRSLAEAAHVLPSGAGPRANEIGSTSPAELKSVRNGIWLCLGCHHTVDQDPKQYPAKVLREWKARHEEVIRRIVGKDLERALLELRDTRRHWDEMREFISFMENRRMLYEELDAEFPPRVLDSINIVRTKVVDVRAKITYSSEFYGILGNVQDLINDFLRNIGPSTDLNTLRCNGNDPTWNHFANELKTFRLSIVVALKALSGDCDYKLRYL